MDILFWLLQLFIWIIVLSFSTIPGIIAGSFSEALFGPFGYWPGYIIGVIAFLITMCPLLFLNKDISNSVPKNSNRSIFSFLVGFWTGNKFSSDE